MTEVRRLTVIRHCPFCATGMNSIVIVGGANQRLCVSDVAAADGLIGSARVLLCQLEVPLETTLAALRAARAHGGQSDSPAISWHLSARHPQ